MFYFKWVVHRSTISTTYISIETKKTIVPLVNVIFKSLSAAKTRPYASMAEESIFETPRSAVFLLNMPIMNVIKERGMRGNLCSHSPSFSIG